MKNAKRIISILLSLLLMLSTAAVAGISAGAESGTDTEGLMILLAAC